MEDDFLSLRKSPPNSVGDSVYNSPSLPRASKDFDHIMIKHRNEVQRVKSCEDPDFTDSDADSRGSPFPLSCSLPNQPISSSFKGRRRTVSDKCSNFSYYWLIKI